MIYSRYHNPERVLKLPISTGLSMLQSALESKREERAYQLYVSVRQNMTEETYETFEEFYKPQKENQEPQNNKSAEEILQDVKEMMNSHSWR